MFTDLPSREDLSIRTNLITSTYTRLFCSREKVNQAAAVILTSEDKAKALGIPKQKWIYPHCGVDVKDRAVISRANYHESASLRIAAEQIFTNQELSLSDIKYIDVYSCFPIMVEFAMDAFDLRPGDGRALTLTGGMPFFGGPGNNYSMHAIAEVVDRLRRDTDALRKESIGRNGKVKVTGKVNRFSC
jgi:acetyl-CoA C-acetyltransferase